MRVLVADGQDERALQILGADSGDLESALQIGPNGLHPHAVAVAADLYGCDSRIREGVRQALDSGQTEVTMWGDAWPADLDRRSVESVKHKLSTAARAFKAQALAALDTPVIPTEGIGLTETFRSGTPASHPVAADLIPVS